MSPQGERVCLVTSGGRGEGLGHVARTAVLARELERRGNAFEIALRGDGSGRELLERELDHPTIRAWAEDCGDLDGYTGVILDTRKPIGPWLDRARTRGIPTLVLDRTDHTDDASWSVLPIAHGSDDDHPRLRQGAEWCLISEVYRDHPLPPYPGDRNVLLVTLGGADPNRCTEAICETVEHAVLEAGISVDRQCVVGPAFEDAEGIRSRLSASGWKVHSAVPRESLRNLMTQSLGAVVGFGTTVYDLAFMGVPALYWTHYAQDVPDARRLESRGIGAFGGNTLAEDRRHFHERMGQTLLDASWCEERSRKARSMMGDGRGAERILDLLGEHRP